MKLRSLFPSHSAVRLSALALACLLLLPLIGTAGEIRPLSNSMENYDSPSTVAFLPLAIEGEDLRMAYMDVRPEGEGNGRTVLLLHGKNFFGAYLKETILF